MYYSIHSVEIYNKHKILAHSKLIKIFRVGINAKFYRYCNNIFSEFGTGVEEILRKMEEEYARI